MREQTEVIELLDIYRQLDTNGRKKMVTAASKLLKTQNSVEDMLGNTQSYQKKTVLSGYLVVVPLLVFAAFAFWQFLISPALLINNDTPLIMLRIIITALFGMFIISTGILRFILRKLKAQWLLLAIAAGLGCIDPRALTDLIGFAIIGLVVAVQFAQIKRTGLQR